MNLEYVKKLLKAFQEKLPEDWVPCLGFKDGRLRWIAVHVDDMADGGDGGQEHAVRATQHRQSKRILTWPPK